MLCYCRFQFLITHFFLNKVCRCWIRWVTYNIIHSLINFLYLFGISLYFKFLKWKNGWSILYRFTFIYSSIFVFDSVFFESWQNEYRIFYFIHFDLLLMSDLLSTIIFILQLQAFKNKFRIFGKPQIISSDFIYS